MPEYGRAYVKVTPDLTGFRQDLEAQLKKMNPEVQVKVKLNLATDKAAAELEAWRRRESGKDIKQNVKVKTDANAAEKAVIGLANGVLSIAPAAARAALGLTALVTAANAAATIGPVLAQASGAALLLPGALGVAAAAMVTVKLGADGIKKAFSALDPVMKNLKSSVSGTFEKSLAPAVRDTSGMLPKLTRGFDSVAQALSGVVVKMAATFSQPRQITTMNGLLGNTSKVVTNVGAALAPLAAAFLNIAKIGSDFLVPMTNGLGNAAKHFQDFTQSAAGVQKIQEWIRGGIRAIEEIGTVLHDLGSIAASVFKAFQDSGVGIAGSFGQATSALANFLQSAQGQSALRDLASLIGTIADQVSRVLTAALQQLGPIINAATPFVRDLIQALGTDLVNAINIVGPILRDIFGFLSANSSWAVPLIKGAIELGLAMKLLGKFSGDAAGSLSTVPGAFGKSGAASGKAFTATAVSAIKGFGWAALGLQVVDAFVGPWFREMSGGKVSGLFDAAVQGWFGGAGTGGKGIIPSIRENMKSVAKAMTEAFTAGDFGRQSMSDILAPWTKGINTAINNAENAAHGLGSAVGASVTQMGNIWGNGLSYMGDAATAKMGQIKSTVENHLNALPAIGSGALAGLGGLVHNGFWTMAEDVGAAVDTVETRTATGFWALNGSVGAAVGDLTGNTANQFWTMTSGIGSAVNEAAGTTNSGFWAMANSAAVASGSLVGSFLGNVSQVPGIAGNSFWGANSAIGTAGGAILGTVGSIAGQIAGRMNVNLYPVGYAISQGLANGILAGIGAVGSAAASVANHALSVARAVAGVASPSKEMYKIGKWFGPGLGNGILDGARPAIDAARLTAQRVVAAIATTVKSVDYGSVSQATWDSLLAAGWKGNPNDNAERLYAPAGMSLTTTGQIQYDLSGTSSLEDKITTALSGWSINQDKQGSFKLVRSAARDNSMGR